MAGEGAAGLSGDAAGAAVEGGAAGSVASGGGGAADGGAAEGGAVDGGAAGSVASGGAAGAGAGATTDCDAFLMTGDPTSFVGATWTYESVDDGIAYALEGILFSPPGSGPFPGAIVNHGLGGTPYGYGVQVARTMVEWGMLAIGPMYTHAPDAQDAGNLPAGDDGRSEANLQRAMKARDLLILCLPADETRLVVHGHSAGAFLAGQLLGTYPLAFRAASHTAGGASVGPIATDAEVAAQIVTPYQLHHGDMDTLVLLEQAQALAEILEENGVPHELNVYPGFDHATITLEPTMFDRVHTWYTTHGVLE